MFAQPATPFPTPLQTRAAGISKALRNCFERRPSVGGEGADLKGSLIFSDVGDMLETESTCLPHQLPKVNVPPCEAVTRTWCSQFFSTSQILPGEGQTFAQ